MNPVLFTTVLLSLAMISSSLAAPRCKEWKRQPNGSQVRNCVGDLGKSYCESCTASGCMLVKCPEPENEHPPSFYNPKFPPKPRPPA